MRRFVPSTQFRRFLPAQEGATAIEYALIACGISIAIVGSDYDSRHANHGGVLR